MKKSKRIVAMLVCVLFTVTLFAGCGSKATDSDADKTGKTDTGAETKGTNDPITITCMFSDHPSQPYQEETWVLPKVIKEKFNITMEMQAIPSSAFEEKRNATLASGDIPDIIVGMEKIVADDYGRKGMFINFMNYKNIMPNMLATLEKYEPLKVHMVSPDEFYVMPGQSVTMGTVSASANLLPLVRMDILKDLGLSTPNTYDELYDMLVQMKKAYPDSFPWIDRCRLTTMFSVLSAGLGLFSCPSGACNTGWTVFNPATEIFTDVMEEENFKFFIEFMKKCYDDGLLDPNYATDTTTEWESKLMSSKGFFTVDYFARPDMMTTIARSSGDEKFSLESMLPPAIEEGQQKIYALIGVRGFNVTSAKTKHPERVCEMIDFWVYSEEGCLLTTYGMKDVTFKVKDGKKLERIYTDTVKTQLDFDAAYGVNYLTFWNFKPDFYGYDLFDENASYYYNQPWQLFEDKLLSPPPAVIFNAGESEKYNEYRIDLNDERLSVLNQFIMGERPMSEWDKAIKELHDIGMTDYLELINSAYKRIYNK